MKTLFKFIFFISLLQFAGVLIDQHIYWRVAINSTVTTNLNLRNDSTFTENIITVIPTNSRIKVLNTSTNWSQIEYGNQRGFVVNNHLSEEQFRPSQALSLIWIFLHIIAVFYFTISAKAGFLRSIVLTFRNLLSPWIAFRFIITLLRRSFSKQKDLEVITFKHSAA